MRKFLSSVFNYVKRFWRLVCFVLGTVFCFASIIASGQKETEYMICWLGFYMCILTPKIVTDTLDALEATRK